MIAHYSDARIKENSWFFFSYVDWRTTWDKMPFEIIHKSNDGDLFRATSATEHIHFILKKIRYVNQSVNIFDSMEL